MRVEQVMQREVRTCGPDDLLNVPARLMWEGDCGCVPVCTTRDDVRRVPIAMITDRDVAMAAYTQGKPLTEIRVHCAMSGEVVTCGAKDTIANALRLLRGHQRHRLPVVDDDGVLVGIVSFIDLARLAAAKPKQREVNYTTIGQTLVDVRAPQPPKAAAVA